MVSEEDLSEAVQEGCGSTASFSFSDHTQQPMGTTLNCKVENSDEMGDE